MFNSQELELLSCSLLAMKDLCESDLLITEDEEFLSSVRTDIAEIETLQAKVQALEGQNQNWHTGA
jgi:hypothetical protein